MVSHKDMHKTAAKVR